MRIHCYARVYGIAATVCLTLVGGPTAWAATPSNVDKQFMVAAAKMNMIEAHEGQMAENQGATDGVKELGKTLKQDHTQAYQQLQALASKTGVSIPDGINSAKIAAVEQLQNLKGAAFDRAFARDEITAHRQAIAEFKREADRGTDPDVKAYARQTISVLEKHLSLAEQCAKSGKHT